MLYRPIVRRSHAAVWSQRAGAIALPLLVIAGVGNRSGLMPTEYALGLFGVVAALGVFAVLTGLIALVMIWNDGRLGFGKALRGFIYGAIAIAPVGLAAVGNVVYPRLTDISTDIVDPPLYRNAAFARAGRMNSVRLPSAEQFARQRAVYPDIVTRRFTIGSDQLFAAARKVVEREGWAVNDLVAPHDDGDRGRIEAVAKTLVFGFEDDVVIRVLGEPNGAKIDLRSSSRWGSHDLGANARRIRAFLTDLDAAIGETYGQEH